MQIKLLNGKTNAVRIWDGIKREWRFTALGRHYYKESTDRYVITFPVRLAMIRHNGSVWTDWSVLKSTATDIGEVTLPTLMPEEEQIALHFIASLLLDEDGDKVLVKGGGSAPHVTLNEGLPQQG